jgi:hypothetical protein
MHDSMHERGAESFEHLSVKWAKAFEERIQVSHAGTLPPPCPDFAARAIELVVVA